MCALTRFHIQVPQLQAASFFRWQRRQEFEAITLQTANPNNWPSFWPVAYTQHKIYMRKLSNLHLAYDSRQWWKHQKSGHSCAKAGSVNTSLSTMLGVLTCLFLLWHLPENLPISHQWNRLHNCKLDSEIGSFVFKPSNAIIARYIISQYPSSTANAECE